MRRRDFLLYGAAAMLTASYGRPARRQPQVVVIGAGIAGLTAAYQLARRGFQPIVLEESGRPGGRMTSDTERNKIIDRGAQFLSSGYSTLDGLIQAVGLQPALQPTSPYTGTVRDHRIRCVRAQSAWSVLESGLLSFSSWMLMGRRLFGDWKELSNIATNTYPDWAFLDNASAAAWARDHYNEEIADWIIEPMMQGFYFQRLEGMSRALPASVLSMGYHRPVTWTLDGGIGRLPVLLAQKLDVRYETPVHAINLTGSGVEVETAQGTVFGDAAVLATPAPVAQRLWRDVDGLEIDLLNTPYSSTIVLAFMLDRKLVLEQPIYGLLIPDVERDVIAAIGIESNKHPGRAPQGELLNVMLTGHDGSALLKVADDVVVKRVTAELEHYFPGVSASIVDVKIIRWEFAEPCSPIGRAQSIKRYRARRIAGKRVFLCGDYMGMPYTEGAAEAAGWAARAVSNLLA